jgi:hypothetical protein
MRFRYYDLRRLTETLMERDCIPSNFMAISAAPPTGPILPAWSFFPFA